MNTKIFTSLKAKLFYYMSALVLLTMAGSAYYYLTLFYNNEMSNIRNSSQKKAESTAAQIQNNIEMWSSRMSSTIPLLLDEEGSKKFNIGNNFINSHSDFVNLTIIDDTKLASNEAISDVYKTIKTTNSNFGSTKVAITQNKITHEIKSTILKYKKNKIKNSIYIKNLGPATRLPLLAIIIKFKVAGEIPKVMWSALTVWQDPIINSLPKSNFINTLLINKKGEYVSSHLLKEITQSTKPKDNLLIKKYLQSKNPSGFLIVNSNKNTINTYSNLKKFNLAVLFEQDTNQASKLIRKNIISSILWASLFILITIMASFFASESITKGIREITIATNEIASGNFNVKLEQKTNDEVGDLSNSIKIMATKITGLMDSQVDQARFEKELETAQAVQSTFFPKKEINTKNLSVSGFYKPASECGGDLWGHFNIRENLDFVYIADATGHGAPAALVTAIAYTTVKTVEDIIKNDNVNYEISPGKLLEKLNRLIVEAVEGKINMTFFACFIDLNKGTLTYANAGHNLPFLLPMLGSDDRVKKTQKSLLKIADVSPMSLRANGSTLGTSPNSKYKEKSVNLKKGDKIFLFTDGLIECKSPNNTMWGRRKMLENLVRSNHKSLKDFLNTIVDEAFNFFAGIPVDDDVTIAVVEVNKNWEKTELVETIKQTDSKPTATPSTNIPASVPKIIMTDTATEILTEQNVNENNSEKIENNNKAKKYNKFKIKLTG